MEGIGPTDVRTIFGIVNRVFAKERQLIRPASCHWLYTQLTLGFDVTDRPIGTLLLGSLSAGHRQSKCRLKADDIQLAASWRRLDTVPDSIIDALKLNSFNYLRKGSQYQGEQPDVDGWRTCLDRSRLWPNMGTFEANGIKASSR